MALFKFSNLLGTVYRKGNLLFTPDGNSVLSPVGNRITVFDLKNNKSETFPFESRMNVTCIALSPNGTTLLAVNEEGEAMLCHLGSRTVMHRYRFGSSINQIKFSPDGRYLAITKENSIFIYRAPGIHKKEYNPFTLVKVYHGACDDTVCVDWTSDSRVFAAGSKDMTTRIYPVEPLENFRIMSISGHNDCMVACFFEENSLDLYTLSKNSHLIFWNCDIELEDLVPWKPPTKVKNQQTVNGESSSSENELEESEANDIKALRYQKIAKYYLRDANISQSEVTCADYHQKSHILVTGYTNGAFLLHELPEANLIHSLSISEQHITSVSFNSTGDWIALGCSGLGQLLVWEWQSETYVLKQQGHFNNMNVLAYSPSGEYIATGGDDGKVKLWNTETGFCFVTFHEHNATITGVTFKQVGKVVISSSLDGTVRAFDMNRYRNFRTLTSPQSVQFSCLAVDPSGEFVCAGGQDIFDIFVWSLQTGHLLEVLSGHEAPVGSLAFSPTSSVLISASWDKTMKIWDVFESKGNKETINLISDGLAVAFCPDGEEVAVATINAQISFFNVHTTQQTGSIEGREDLGSQRRDIDLITAKSSSFGKAFTTICYSADGKCILAGGRSKNVCIYSVKDEILLRKFEISCNLSFDGMQEFLNRRKMTDFGNIDLIEGDGEERVSISLPGVRKGDMASRSFKPEVRVSSIQFSPTGRSWAATTTEGLLIYSLDNSISFNPFELEMNITLASVRQRLHQNDFISAVIMSLKLNEKNLIEEVVESIALPEVELVSQNLPQVYVEKLLDFVASRLESSRHLEFYQTWMQKLIFHHGRKLKEHSKSIMPLLTTLQKNNRHHAENLGKMCDHNMYMLKYLTNVAELRKRKRKYSESEEPDPEKAEQSDESLHNTW